MSDTEGDDLPDFDPRNLKEKIEEIESGNYMRPMPGLPPVLAAMVAERRAQAPERLKELKAQEEEWARFEANATPEQRERFQQRLDAWDAEKRDEERVQELIQLAQDRDFESESRLAGVHDEDWQTMSADRIHTLLDEADAPEQVIFKALVEALRTPVDVGEDLFADEDLGEDEGGKDVPPIVLADGTEIPWEEATAEQQQEAYDLGLAEFDAHMQHIQSITREIQAKAETPEGAGSNMRLCPDDGFQKNLTVITTETTHELHDAHADAAKYIEAAYQDMLEQFRQSPQTHWQHYEAAAYGRIEDLLSGLKAPGWAVIELLLQRDGMDTRQARRNDDGTLRPGDES